jgi:serine protease Do
MKRWTTAAVTVALLAGLAVGAAVAPAAFGQTRVRVEPNIVQWIAGGARIGVSVRDAEAEDAKQARLANPTGVVIEDVRDGSPAEKAGFKSGDLVIEFDGERVRSTRQFTRLVQETPAGRQVQAVVMRGAERVTLTVEPESSSDFSYFDLDRFGDVHVLPRAPRPPAPPEAPAPRAPQRLERFFSFDGLFNSSGRLGITVQSLSDQLGDYFGAKEGVLVTSVTADSAAAKAGLKAGDVITSVDGAAVASTSELSRRIQRLDDGDDFSLEIVRDKKTMTLKGKLEPRERRRWTTHTIGTVI